MAVVTKLKATGIGKALTAFGQNIKNNGFVTAVSDSFKNLLVSVRSSLSKLYTMMKLRFAQIRAISGKFAVTGVALKAGKVTNFILEITGWKAIKKAIYEAQFAQLQYLVTQEAYGAKSNLFIKLMHGVKGFTKSLLVSMNVMKMVKIALMGMGIIGVIFGAVAVVMLLVKNFKALGSAGDGAKKNFKEAFGLLKDVLGMVIKPFKDLIQTFMDLMTGSVGTGKQFESFGEKAKKIATAVKNFFEKYVVPALNFLLTGSVNLIRGIVTFIQGLINLIKGDWKKGLFQMLQGVVLFVGVVVKLYIKFVTLIIQVYFFLYKKSLEIFGGIAKGIGNLLGAAFKWVIMKMYDMIKSFTGFMKHIPVLKQLRSALLSTIEAGANLVDSTFSGIGSIVDKIARGASGLLDGIQNIAVKALNGIGNLAQSGFDKIIDSTKKLSDGAGIAIGKDAEVNGREFADVFTDPIAAGLDEVIDGASGKLKEMLDDLRQKFVDLVLDEVAQKVGEAVDQLQSALEKQKEAALHVYDVQLETLDKLAKAEESLTKEKEYQADRRRMIDERALQSQNYIRNRALAIYEGRIDDARVLTLQDNKDTIDFNESLTKVDEARRKDLAQENLDALKDAIQAAKVEADKFFDDQIKAFADAAKEITKFPPQTVEEYTTQLGQLNTAAQTIATNNGTIFEGMLNKMATDIKLPNEGVGVFATSLDELVTTAQAKYGLTATTDDNSVVGATIGMLAGIQGQIGDNTAIGVAFSGIVDGVLDTANGFRTTAIATVTTAMTDIATVIETNNPFTVFETAISNANTTLLREITGTVGAIGSLVDGLSDSLSTVIQQLSTINFMRDNPDTSGGDDSGDDSSDDTPPSSKTRPSETVMTRYAAAARAQIKEDIKKTYPDLTINQHTALLDKVNSAVMTAYMATYGMGQVNARKYLYNQVRTITDVGVQRMFAGYWDPTGMLGLEGDGYANGGHVRKFGKGGYNVPGFGSQSVPAMLHGGEYVINSKAVANVGMATLSMLNDMRFKKPNYDTPTGVGGGSSSVTTTNIYVENFIGEDKWFQSMLKQYNMTVLPSNQKSAGMENRVVKSYSGLARGL